MTLEEAIKHCEEVANRERELYSLCPEKCVGLSDCRELKHGKDRGCLKYAEEHEQLAEWLKELKDYQDGSRYCFNCKYKYQSEVEYPCSICMYNHPNKFEWKEVLKNDA